MEQSQVKRHYFEFSEGEPIYYSDDDLYALNNGYAIAAVNRLVREDQRDAVLEAADVLTRFFEAARDQGVIGEM